ncbi:MAG: hypothetical protein IIX76_05265, partial [Bacteroidales bacterium]|nr:hypothetical protein [Bacteroidales bacterium]
MKLNFSVNYKAQCGQLLCVTGDIEQLGLNDVANAYELSCDDNDNWNGAIDIEGEKELTYKYCVKGEDGIFYEAGSGRKVALEGSLKEINLKD